MVYTRDIRVIMISSGLYTARSGTKIACWSVIIINTTDKTAYTRLNTKGFTIFILKDLCVNSAYTSSCIDVTVTSPYVWVVFLFGQYCSHLSIYEQQIIVPCHRRMMKVMNSFAKPYSSCNQTTLDHYGMLFLDIRANLCDKVSGRCLNLRNTCRHTR